VARSKGRESIIEELLTEADGQRTASLRSLAPDRQRNLGQFFTPRVLAERIADEPRLPSDGLMRILDPGAGTGILSAAVVARVLRERPRVGVRVTVVEVAPDLAVPLSRTLDACETAARALGTRLEFEVVAADFVAWVAGQASSGWLDSGWTGKFDLIVENPPYRKVAKDSAVRRHLRAFDMDVPNLYAAFLGLSAHMLDHGGQLVAITPRSFANGTYFHQFRKKFLGMMGIDRLTVFHERGALFSDLSVLQENIIMAATRGRRPEKVAISSARWHGDSNHERLVLYADIVDPKDGQSFLHIPTDSDDDLAGDTVAALPAELDDLGLQVSTGKVVDFRASWALRDMPDHATVPLIYPGHLHDGSIRWPLVGYRKPNALAVDDRTRKLLLPSGFYVLVKRFSAKEETRRVVASVVDPKDFSYSWIGFENHLNVFHGNGAGFQRDVAVGLALWLNSTVLDLHFRRFSGHTQVNATDLRNLRYPSLDQLESLGAHLGQEWPNQDDIDTLVRIHILDGIHPIKREVPMTEDAVATSIGEARGLLKALNFDAERSNERSALVLRALLGLEPGESWSESRTPSLRTVEIMDFLRRHYSRDYKPNTRETIRRQTLHQFAAVGLVTQNPDDPDRPINSPRWWYQVTDHAVALIRTFQEVWCADQPTHLVHFNGERFLGPYPEKS
jgi:adenine-specific DNA-methyltransferase